MTDAQLRALWVLGADYHSGMGSRGYRIMCRARRLLDCRGLGIGCTHSIRETAEYVRLRSLAEKYF